MSSQDREILRLAVPAFFALVSEPLMLLADSAIVGRLGTPQLAALGVAGTILQTMVGLCVFLAYGTTSAVARRIGAGDHRGALAQGLDGLWLALLLGVVLAVLGVLLAPQAVGAFDPAPDVADHAVTYLRISCAGIPSMLLLLAATGVLRGLQDTTTPMIVAISANLANIGLNLLLVYGLGLDIAGSALGTALAQTAAGVALVWVVVRGARRDGASLRPDRPGILASARSGVPLLVRTLTLRVAIVIAAFVATSLGTTSVAAHQVAFTLWMFLALALDAIAIAAQALTGRALGSGDVVGTRAITRRMMWWGLGSGSVSGARTVGAARPVRAPVHDRPGGPPDAGRGTAGGRDLAAGQRRRLRAGRRTDRRRGRVLPGGGRIGRLVAVRAGSAGRAVVRRRRGGAVVGLRRLHVLAAGDPAGPGTPGGLAGRRRDPLRPVRSPVHSPARSPTRSPTRGGRPAVAAELREPRSRYTGAPVGAASW
jgi:putative MATE family efflux protein